MRERRIWIPRIMGIHIGLLVAGDAMFGEKSRGDMFYSGLLKLRADGNFAGIRLWRGNIYLRGRGRGS
jgi:hypothetical protein